MRSRLLQLNFFIQFCKPDGNFRRSKRVAVLYKKKFLRAYTEWLKENWTHSKILMNTGAPGGGIAYNKCKKINGKLKGSCTVWCILDARMLVIYSSLIIFQRAELSTRSITHLCWRNWRTFWRKNAARKSSRVSCSCTTVSRLTGHMKSRRNWPTWASNVLIAHRILRIWPYRTTTYSLD